VQDEESGALVHWSCRPGEQGWLAEGLCVVNHQLLWQSRRYLVNARRKKRRAFVVDGKALWVCRAAPCLAERGDEAIYRDTWFVEGDCGAGDDGLEV
jgi:hypothetical protein